MTNQRATDGLQQWHIAAKMDQASRVRFKDDHQRPAIERFARPARAIEIREMKNELGWADFMVRSDRAIRRHWTLVLCAWTFC